VQIHQIREAFYEMNPELAVDLFTDHHRETVRETATLGTRYTLEIEFKKCVVGTEWEKFSDEEVAQLRRLVAYMRHETPSKAIVGELKHAEWFDVAFAAYREVANDMFGMYFRRDVQLRLSDLSARERLQIDANERRIEKIKAQIARAQAKLVHPGEPGYEEADEEDGSSGSEYDCGEA
ncbi:MAG: hypothetical protein INR71_04300, partial [Terriglobus roseus]|nr:hypothetical protein [Terriglobus roseus]